MTTPEQCGTEERRPDRRTPDIQAGDVLPALEIPITRTLIVAGALASRDYQDVHHDAELAKEKGSPDIFMNILTTNGLVGRYLTDHFGPAAVLQKLAIRLGAPNYPGDTMTLTGTITDVDAATDTAPGAARDAPTDAPTDAVTKTHPVPETHPTIETHPATETHPPTVPTPTTGGTTVQVRITGTNALGHHVTGTATVRLTPDGAAASCPSSPRRSPGGTV